MEDIVPVITKTSKPALIFAFAAGLAIGVYGGAAYLRKAFAAEMSAKMDEEIASLRSQYGAMKKPWTSPEEAVKVLHPNLTTNSTPKVHGFEAPEDVRDLIAYDKIREFKSGDIAPDENIDPEEEHALEAEFGTPQVSSEIYKISHEVFTANEKSHSQEALWFYSIDKVVTNERDDKLDNPEKYLGANFFDSFNGDLEFENMLHIRNEELGIDYEIVRQEQSFAELMGGSSEDNASPRHRINGV